MRKLRYTLYDLLVALAQWVCPAPLTYEELSKMSPEERRRARGDYFVPDPRTPDTAGNWSHDGYFAPGMDKR